MAALCTNVPHLWGTFVHEVGQARAEAEHFRESHNKCTNKYFNRLLLSAEKDQNPHYLQPKYVSAV